MSLIHTAELNHAAPFEYLIALQRLDAYANEPTPAHANGPAHGR